MRIFPLFPSPHLQFPAAFSSSPFSHFITARTHTHVCLHRFALEPNFRPRKMNNRPYNETLNLITLIQPVPIFCLMSSSKRYWIRCYCRQNIRHVGQTNAVEQTLWVRKHRECKERFWQQIPYRHTAQKFHAASLIVHFLSVSCWCVCVRVCVCLSVQCRARKLLTVRGKTGFLSELTDVGLM